LFVDVRSQPFPTFLANWHARFRLSSYQAWSLSSSDSDLKKKRKRRTSSPSFNAYGCISNSQSANEGHGHRDSIEDQLFDIIESPDTGLWHAGKLIEKLPCHRALTSYSVNRLHCRSRSRSPRGSGERQLALRATQSHARRVGSALAVTRANLERAKREVDALRAGGSSNRKCRMRRTVTTTI
jgi:hypothetical protein